MTQEVKKREMEMASANAAANRAMREATLHMLREDAQIYWDIWQETEIMARAARERWLAAVAEEKETNCD